MAKLKRLDGKGRLWPQQMIMEVHRGYLLLSDIETKTKAVLDSCAYNSVLTITVDERNKRSPQVYMFQCEETGVRGAGPLWNQLDQPFQLSPSFSVPCSQAEVIKADLDKVLDYRGAPADDEDEDVGVEPRTAQPDIKYAWTQAEPPRINLENIMRKHFRQPEPYIMPREKSPPPLPDLPPPQWREAGTEMLPPLRPYSPQDYPEPSLDFQDPGHSSAVPSLAQMDSSNNTEIFNHILDDIEIFLNKIGEATAAQEERSQKKKGFMKKRKSKSSSPDSPSGGGAQLDGVLSSPSPSDFVHILFSGLAMVQLARRHPTVRASVLRRLAATYPCPASLPEPQLPTVLQEQLSELPGAACEGRAAAAVNVVPAARRRVFLLPLTSFCFYMFQLQRAPPVRARHLRLHGQERPRAERHQGRRGPGEAGGSAAVRGSAHHLRLSKQVVKRSNHWWLIRNRGEEGSVPQNVLELMGSSSSPVEEQWSPRGAVTLDMNSTPPEVKAWLEHKGFSRITVNTLGVLTGKLLLGMTKEEIRTVCPEEGSKVFFQLQTTKSAMAVSQVT
ncbi:unnamed protein product [Tetraodon nigroviridis]|uniref:(spotted green pufferfish) hypothetical protein n=1 Tax=Tetraodon nigroviridis TaxID=99883 RepID=Q4RVS1_TETNG|nr:unnamed protein product [Tetraodon nigroviridis]